MEKLVHKKTFTRSDLSPGVHTISLTVSANGISSDPKVSSLEIINGLVIRPPYICPCIIDEKEIESEHNKPDCDCRTGYTAVYSESLLSLNSAVAGQYIEFNTKRDTYANIHAKIVTLGRTGGIYGTGYTHFNFLHARPPLGNVLPPYEPGKFYEHLDVHTFEDFASWDDWLGAILTMFGDYIPYHIDDIIELISDTHDLLEVQGINAEELKEVLLNNGGEIYNYETTPILIHPGIGSLSNQMAFNIWAGSGGGWAKAARFSLMEYVTIEESDSGPGSGLGITGLCPIYLTVTDPEGHTNSNIPNATYTQSDIDFDGEKEEQIYIPNVLKGNYSISVEPAPGANLSDNFSILLDYGGYSSYLVQNVNISDIPSNPYVFMVTSPNVPSMPSGPSSGAIGNDYSFTTSTIHPEGKQVWYQWDWGDGNTTWLGPYESGETVQANHTWTKEGSYEIKVKAKNCIESNWSESIFMMITNNPPNTPTIPSGRTRGLKGSSYTYNTSTTDPNENNISYMWDWGDGNITGWLGLHPSGQIVSASHTWSVHGSYSVKAKAKDTLGAESNWSTSLTVNIFKPGDVNNDSMVTFADIDPFVAALGTTEEQFQTAHSTWIWIAADCNKDGMITFADIDPFVAVIGT